MSKYILFIDITLSPDTRDQFMPLIRENAKNSSSREPGCIQFDVLLPIYGKKNTVYLYEIYQNKKAFEEHQATRHYQEFKARTKKMIVNMKILKLRGL